MLICLTSYDLQNTYISMFQCKYMRSILHMNIIENILLPSMRFEIITVVSITITAFRDLKPCNLVNGNRRFGE